MKCSISIHLGFLLGDITGLSQISCSFYSLESRFGIRDSVDLLLTANGSAHSGILTLVGAEHRM